MIHSEQPPRADPASAHKTATQRMGSILIFGLAALVVVVGLMVFAINFADYADRTGIFR